MTGAMPAAAGPAAAVLAAGVPLSFVLGDGHAADSRVAWLAGLIDPAFLAEAGWDPRGRVLAPPPGHRLLGRRDRGAAPDALAGDTGVAGEARPAAAACAVPGCRRPAGALDGQLCRSHRHSQRHLGVPLEEFIADPRARALPGCGTCQVTACTRDRISGTSAYCEAHRYRWLRASRADPGLDERSWALTASPIPVTGQVIFAGLPPAVTIQVLYGLQQRTRAGLATSMQVLRLLIEDVRQQQFPSLLETDLKPSRTVKHKLALWHSLVRHVRRSFADPRAEAAKDVWELEVFGFGGRLSFTAITQPWLRESAKRWAADELPRHRGGAGAVMRGTVASITRLSEFLRAAREDNGGQPALLARADIESFLHRLAYLTSAGACSPAQRTKICRDVRRVLARIRVLGLTRPGGAAAGLGDDFALAYGDIPAEPERPEPGRDLPAEIQRQLCAQLPLLEQAPSGREIRCAVELLTDTGRRPAEILRLQWDCLAYDPDGSPVLVYDNHKRQRPGRRLPVSHATARVITAQQQHVRERFPATAAADLVLLPSPVANPAGRRAISGGTLDLRHRSWISELPPLLTGDGTEFSKAKIVPYCYRHTYAQRHADAGVPIDVLRELMDHKIMDTTKGYYRVGEARRREAVDKVTAMQFDRHGHRIWRDARALLESGHARYGVGETAVPYGTCTEPSNVQAGGGACPIRFRCAGCDHFRTDVSHLPDLAGYLDDLLRTRERLTAAIDGVDEWARADASPAEEEITRIRRLISRIKTDITQLSDTERAQIDEAVTVVRRHRAARTVSLGIPGVGAPLPSPRTEALA